jgi:DNA repair protein RadC
MTYSLIISIHLCNPKYVNNIGTWGEVTDYLKNKLSNEPIMSVEIFKYSKNNRLLGEKYVTMGNFFEVATSKTDKILL